MGNIGREKKKIEVLPAEQPQPLTEPAGHPGPQRQPQPAQRPARTALRVPRPGNGATGG